MNKSIALLIIGVISLAMVLIMLNHGTSTTTQPPLVGVQNPLPQTGMTTTPALQVPANPPSAPALVPQKSPTMPSSGSLTQPTSPPAPPAGMIQPSQAQNVVKSNSDQVLSPTAPNTPDGTKNTKVTAERNMPPSAAASTSIVAEKAAAPVEKGEKVEKKVTPPPAPPKATGPKTINKITVSPAGNGANVRIAGTAVLAYKTMHLKSPDRVVVDLEGVWAVKAPGVPANKAVTNVRIGKQPDKTRIVIDLATAGATVNFIKVDNETLEVRIK